MLLAHSVISHCLIKMVTHLTTVHNYWYNLHFAILLRGQAARIVDYNVNLFPVCNLKLVSPDYRPLPVKLGPRFGVHVVLDFIFDWTQWMSVESIKDMFITAHFRGLLAFEFILLYKTTISLRNTCSTNQKCNLHGNLKGRAFNDKLATSTKL
jgi:hypothetical protein